MRTARTRDGGVPANYFGVLHGPAQRDPRGYILPSDQADFPTATKFVNTLIKNGVTVLRAAGDFDVAGRHYPAQSYIVPAAQAFRPHVLDMFEPQDHPNDFQYPGGPPIPPYDNAGWTLAYQMGVSFDRILDRFDGPFEPVRDTATPPAGTVSHADGAAGFLLSHRLNDAAIATNRLLAKGEEVDWLAQPVAANGREYPAGTIFIPATPASVPLVRRLATDLGLSFDGLATRPAPALRVRPVRIGLWDRYGGSIPSGWTRWLLERFEFPFEVVYPPTLDAGKLADRYDVLVFPDGAIPQNDRDQPDDFFGPPPPPETIPAEFRNRLGRVSVQKTVPLLRQFLADGGTSSRSAARPAWASTSVSRWRVTWCWTASPFPAPNSTCRARCSRHASTRHVPSHTASQDGWMCSSTTVRCSTSAPMQRPPACARSPGSRRPTRW